MHQEYISDPGLYDNDMAHTNVCRYYSTVGLQQGIQNDRITLSLYLFTNAPYVCKRADGL